MFIDIITAFNFSGNRNTLDHFPAPDADHRLLKTVKFAGLDFRFHVHPPGLILPFILVFRVLINNIYNKIN